jgi:hypothetical protein
MPFKNFKIWRGKLPHWRADDVVYFVTFRHSRDLLDMERAILFAQLLRPDSQKYDLTALLVLADRTELIFRVRMTAEGPIELSKVVEHAKQKAGRRIMKSSGERYPPFFAESYDRIIRDEVELEERLDAMISAPDDIDNYPTLFVAPTD